MKFLGISIKDIPDSAKLLYVLIFAAVVIGALYYGLSNVDQKETKKSNKRRSPKKDTKTA
jgi:NADH:ubiquinone oxidoreductase subunit 4 (subunit M)